MGNRRFHLIGIISVIIYGLFSSTILFGSFREKLKPVLYDNFTIFIVIFLLLLLLLLYSIGFRYVREKSATAKSIFVYGLIFSFLAFLTLPLTSVDIYNYIAQGRIISVFGENPYLVSYSQFPNDLLFGAVNTIWADTTSVYGPVFISLSGMITKISGDNLMLSVYLFKFLMLVITALSSYILYLLTSSKRALYLLLWNPLVLFETALNGHNEGLFIFFVLLAIYFASKLEKDGRRTSFFGLVSLILSVHIKIYALLFVPFYMLYLVSEKRDFASKFKKAVSLLFISVLLFVLFYLPYFSGSDTFRRYFEVADLWTISASPIISFFYYIFYILGTDNFIFLSKLIGFILFVAVYVFILTIYYKKKNISFASLVWGIFYIWGSFLLLASAWIMPWYYILLIATLALSMGVDGRFKYSWAVVALTFYPIIQYIVLR